jgi:hypothetical protein
VLLDGRPGGAFFFERFEPGGDVDRFHPVQSFEAARKGLGGKAADGVIVGAPGVVVRDLGGARAFGGVQQAIKTLDVGHFCPTPRKGLIGAADYSGPSLSVSSKDRRQNSSF